MIGDEKAKVCFRKLQWLFPVAVALHNLEEAIWMPGWASKHHVPTPIDPSPITIRGTLLVLTLAAVLVTCVSRRTGKRSLGTALFFGYCVTMLVNVPVPHLALAVWFRSYAPGAVTAVAVNAPVMSLLVYRALKERQVAGAEAWVSGTFVPLGLAAAVAVIFAL